MCYLCETRPVYEFTNKRKLCKNCFIHWFEKKFLFINRKFNLIKRGDNITIKKDKSYQYAVLKYLLENFKNKLMIQVDNKNTNKLIINSTTDETAQQIVQILINEDTNKLTELSPIIQRTDNKKIIKPLYLFTDEEVLLYAKLKRLKFSKSKENKDKISKFINELELKHPEVKRAVVNSYLELYKR